MSFWQKQTVLVTGANGFVGSHLVKRLLEENAKVITLAKKKTEVVSVTNFEKLNQVINKNKINIIFHLAAQPIVETGKASPVNTFEVNIKGTWNILEAARENNVGKVIIASTAHVYGDNPNVPFKESYYPQPSRPYETSKACADLLAQTYADSYNLAVEIPRFVNIYGPGDFNFERLIPKVIRSTLKYGYPQVWDVGSVRDFLYIDDAINAYLILAQKNIPNIKRERVFNFGTGKPINVSELVKKIISLIDSNIKIKTESLPEERSQEIKKQYVSIAKAKKELGWYPTVSLEEGLKRTVGWYKQNRALFI